MPSSKSRVTEKGKPEVSKTGNTWCGHASTVDEMLFRAAHRPVFVAAFAPQLRLATARARCTASFGTTRCTLPGAALPWRGRPGLGPDIYTGRCKNLQKKCAREKQEKIDNEKSKFDEKEDAPKAGRKQDKGWEMSIMGFDSR